MLSLEDSLRLVEDYLSSAATAARERFRLRLAALADRILEGTGLAPGEVMELRAAYRELKATTWDEPRRAFIEAAQVLHRHQKLPNELVSLLPPLPERPPTPWHEESLNPFASAHAPLSEFFPAPESHL